MSDVNQTLTCAFHPKRETTLRCNRCDKPICIKCATHTPTGYRCPECIRSQQKIFITAKWTDMIIAVILTGLISFLGSLVASFLGFFTIFVAMGAGALAVTVVRKVIKNRKAPLLNHLMTASALIGSLPLLVIRAALILPYFFQVGLEASGSLLALFWFALYSALVTSTVYYQQRN
jgi:hypothetical protein